MKITPVKTRPIRAFDSLENIFDEFLPSIQENTILAVTSKIVSLCEGRVVSIGEKTKHQLVEEEAEYYLPPEMNAYGFPITINNHTLIPNAGIDESNGNGYYVLWPQDPQTSANTIREYIRNKYDVKNFGVIIVDSKTLPLRRGVAGTALSHSGFQALNNYVGKKDIFGRTFTSEVVNVAEGLAASAVLAMGEGNEQTPLALVEDIPFVTFQERNPTEEELQMLKISLEDDIYASLLTSVPWKKGKGRRK